MTEAAAATLRGLLVGLLFGVLLSMWIAHAAQQVLFLWEERAKRRQVIDPGTGTKVFPERCPTCASSSPERHPALQFEGEVQPCRDLWHLSTSKGVAVLLKIGWIVIRDPREAV